MVVGAGGAGSSRAGRRRQVGGRGGDEPGVGHLTAGKLCDLPGAPDRDVPLTGEHLVAEQPPADPLHVRHLDAGSSNGCDWEIAALLNPYHDIQRLGIDFVSKDALLVHVAVSL